MGQNIGSSLVGKPHPAEGSSGDIQLRLDGSPKAFSKLGPTWYQTPLFTHGNGIEHTSRGLSVQVDAKSVANLGDTIRLGKKQNDKSRVELDISGNFSIKNRQGTTDVEVLQIATDGSITTKGTLTIDTRVSGSDVPIRLNNDGTGYNQFFFTGANPEIRMGYSGSGGSPSLDIDGSSKIFMTHANNIAYLATIDFSAVSSSIYYNMGRTYDEFRVAVGQDIRKTEECAIKVDTDGTTSMPLGNGFHRIQMKQDVRFAHDLDSGADTVAVQLAEASESGSQVVKIPAHSIITTVTAVVTIASNLDPHIVNIQLSDTSGTAADSAISSGTEILGAGAADTDSTDSTSASDINMTGDHKKVWINRSNIVITADKYVYICNAGDNGTTNPSAGTLNIVIEYYGID